MKKINLEEILYYTGSVTNRVYRLGSSPKVCSISWHPSLEIPFLVSQQQFTHDKQFLASPFLVLKKITQAYLNISLLLSRVLITGLENLNGNPKRDFQDSIDTSFFLNVMGCHPFLVCFVMVSLVRT